MILHDFDKIAVNKDLHLESFLMDMPVVHVDIKNDRNFYIDAYINNPEVEDEIFERAYGTFDDSEQLRNYRKEFQIILSDPAGGFENAGINCFVYAEKGRYCASADLSDDEKRVLLNHIAEAIPESRNHVDYELGIINARAAEKGKSSPKKTQLDYGY